MSGLIASLVLCRCQGHRCANCERLIKLMLASFMMLASTLSFAADKTWLCTEEASQRVENSIHACGIGTGIDENAARLKAFDSARAEFNKVCHSSDDCKGRTVTIEPKRTSCEQGATGAYKCYRLVVFSMGGGSKARIKPAPYVENPDLFTPFVYDESDNIPRVKIGMSRAQLLAQFGAPETVDPLTYDGMTYQYKGKMCITDSLPCYVHFDAHKKVRMVDDFKAIYTDYLK